MRQAQYALSMIQANGYFDDTTTSPGVVLRAGSPDEPIDTTQHDPSHTTTFVDSGEGSSSDANTALQTVSIHHTVASVDSFHYNVETRKSCFLHMSHCLFVVSLYLQFIIA